MAKSIRAKSNKRFRAELRRTVGQKQLNKNLRKTTRRLLKNLATPVAGQATIDDLKNILSKSGGIDNGFVTTEPLVKKKLPYSFNHKYRQQRLENDLEDETDDEAVEQLQKEKEETMNDNDNDENSNDENEAEEEIEVAGMLKAPEKPLPKRQMTTRHYEWELKDLINPSVPGLYDVVHKPSSSRQRWLANKNKKRGTKGPIAGVDMQ